MANIESLDRRIKRLKAATNSGRLRIIWRAPGSDLKLPDEIDADDELLIITWQAGEGDETSLPAHDS